MWTGEPSSQLGRVLIVAGIALTGVGLLIVVLSRYSTFGLGRLPGDIAYKGKHGSFYFPIVTCLVLSVVLSVVLWLISFLTRR